MDAIPVESSGSDVAGHVQVPRDPVAALLQHVARRQRHQGGGPEHQGDPHGALPLVLLFFLLLSGLHGVGLLPAGRIALRLPGQVGPRAVQQPQPRHPEAGQGQVLGRQPERDQRLRELRPHHGDDQHGGHQDALQHQHQGRRLPRQRALARHTDVQRDQHDRLERDAAQNVADGDADVMVQRGGRRDGDLRQVRCERQQDQPAQRFPQVEARVEGVRRVRQEDARHPHRPRGGEDEQEDGQREV